MTQLAPRPTRDSAMARRWDPLSDLYDLQNRMGRLSQVLFAAPSMIPDHLASLAAPADIEETDDAFIVELDLPNVRAEDVRLELEDGRLLRTHGEIKTKERTGVLRRQERRTGEFEHVVTLPADVEPDSVDATLADGVLTVRLRKARDHQPRRIEVKPGEDSKSKAKSGRT